MYGQASPLPCLPLPEPPDRGLSQLQAQLVARTIKSRAPNARLTTGVLLFYKIQRSTVMNNGCSPLRACTQLTHSPKKV